MKKFNSGQSPASAVTPLLVIGLFFGEDTMSLSCGMNLKNGEFEWFWLLKFCGEMNLVFRA